MACPFFMPMEKFDSWPTFARTPLGHGWKGHCTAPGHERDSLSDRELKDFCNFGYAKHCARLPEERLCDAVRFSIARERNSKIIINFACEVEHRPGEHGALEYDLTAGAWTAPHRDERVQKMAQCCLEAYLERRHNGV